MKKFISLMLGVVVVLSISACNEDVAKNSSDILNIAIDNKETIPNQNEIEVGNDKETSTSENSEYGESSSGKEVTSENQDSNETSKPEELTQPGSPTHKHKYVGKVTNTVSCENNGIKTFTCSCGSYYTETIAAIGHSWNEWKTTKSPTPYTDGNSQRKCNICGKTENKSIPYEYLMNSGVVCHAGGIIEGYTVTNALEAFEHSYTQGHRFFEVDISETSDGELVCAHGWNESDYLKYYPWEKVSGSYQPTLKEFSNYRIGNDYTPITLTDFINWMQQHQDVYVIFDIKLCDYKTANTIANKILISVNDKQMLSRMVMSARTTDMMRGYSDAYSFPWLHMLFADDSVREESIYTAEDFLRFCKEFNVSSYSISASMYTKELANKLDTTGLKCYVYMVQSSYDAAQYVSMGADFVISDYLKADCLNHLQNNGDNGLVAEKGADGITLNWNVPENATSFSVIRTDSQGSEKKEFTVSSTELPFVDTTVKSNFPYIYYVKALLDDSGKTVITPEETFIWGDKPQVKSVEKTDTGIKITWDSVGCAIKYRVSRKIGSGDYEIIKMCDANKGYEYIDTSLPSNINEPVYYRINAELTDGSIICYSGYGKPVKLNIPSVAE